MIKHLFILFVFLSSSICAETLTVIYDSGDALPIKPYLPEEIEKIDRQRQNKGALESLFPVHSPSLSPGVVEIQAMSLPYLHSPMFVIGYDDLSLKWLENHAERLKEVGAVGMVVSVDTMAQFKEIKNTADTLEFIPASGEGIHSFLGLRHYPALITKQGIEQ